MRLRMIAESELVDNDFRWIVIKLLVNDLHFGLLWNPTEQGEVLEQSQVKPVLLLRLFTEVVTFN